MSTHPNANSRFFVGAIAIFALTMLVGGVLIYHAYSVEEPSVQKASPTTGPATSVTALTQQARQLAEAHQYRDALTVIDEILAIDPQNDYARGSRALMEDRALIQEQRHAADDFARGGRPLGEDGGLTQDQRQAAAAKKEEVNAPVLAAIDKKLPEIKFDGVPFDEMVGFLRDVTKINIFVNWKSIQAAGLDRKTPVTARLRDTKFGKALDILLRELGGGKTKLGYTVDEGVLVISTADDLASNVVTNVYDIRDLIVNVEKPEDPQSPTRSELAKEIIRLIEETIDASSWTSNGGKFGNIRELSSQLIVTQTPENQQSVKLLLSQMRETRAIQISIETSIVDLPDALVVSLPKDLFISDALGEFNTKMAAASGKTPATQPATFFLDDEWVKRLTLAATSRITSPRVTLFNGQTSEIGVAIGNQSIKLFLQATISSDHRFATVTTRVGDSSHPTTHSIPDGATILLPYGENPPTADHRQWMLLKPTLIFQRQQEQAQFPLIKS